jgi:hypothetical protein
VRSFGFAQEFACGLLLGAPRGRSFGKSKTRDLTTKVTKERKGKSALVVEIGKAKTYR